MGSVNPADHLALVGHIAKQYVGRGMTYEELRQEGVLGLMSAVRKFDPSKSAFSTYAGLWIHAFLRNAVKWQPRLIRVPIEKFHAMRAAGELPRRPMSFDMPCAGDDDLTLHDCLPDSGPDPETCTSYNEEAGLLWRELGALSERETKILQMRFVEGLSMRAVGRELGLSHERISQIEKRALRRLRGSLSRQLDRAA